MKLRTARRFVVRNEWRYIAGSGKQSFRRQYRKCLRIILLLAKKY